MAGKLKDPFEETKQRFKRNDLRQIWRKVKRSELSKVKKILGAKATKNLEDQFDRGLGPSLEAWTVLSTQLPNIKRNKLIEAHDKITHTIDNYTADIRKMKLVGTADMVLTGVLKLIRGELDRQVKWYKDVGLW